MSESKFDTGNKNDSSANNNSVIEYDYLISWMSQRLDMLGYKESTWEDGSNTVLIDFISGIGPKTLSVCSNENKILLICDETGQEIRIKNLNAYFLRPSVNIINKENISKEIQFGTVGKKGLSMNTLKRLMDGFVEKQVGKFIYIHCNLYI